MVGDAKHCPTRAFRPKGFGDSPPPKPPTLEPKVSEQPELPTLEPKSQEPVEPTEPTESTKKTELEVKPALTQSQTPTQVKVEKPPEPLKQEPVKQESQKPVSPKVEASFKPLEEQKPLEQKPQKQPVSENVKPKSQQKPVPPKIEPKSPELESKKAPEGQDQSDLDKTVEGGAQKYGKFQKIMDTAKKISALREVYDKGDAEPTNIVSDLKKELSELSDVDLAQVFKYIFGIGLENNFEHGKDPYLVGNPRKVIKALLDYAKSGDKNKALEFAEKMDPNAEEVEYPYGVPDHPIRQQIESWEEGKSLIQQIQIIRKEVKQAEEAKANYAKLVDITERTFRDYLKVDPNSKEAKKFEAQLIKDMDDYNKKRDQYYELLLNQNKKVFQFLQAKNPSTIDVELTSWIEDESESGRGDAKILKQFFRMGKDFVSSLLENVDLWLKNKVKGRVHNKRAEYDPIINEIRISFLDTARTVVHELGHFIEEKIPGVSEAALDFLEYRTKGEPLIQLNQKFPYVGYKDWEKGRKDQFDKIFDEKRAYYVGKHYNDGKATEIISMGLELLYTDPVGFATKDPEYFTFLVGILRGPLRVGLKERVKRAFKKKEIFSNYLKKNLGENPPLKSPTIRPKSSDSLQSRQFH